MNIHKYGESLYVMDLEIGRDFKIKINKMNRRKFKLKGSLKKLLKNQGITYYFLWGNEFPTQIVLRDVTDQKLVMLNLMSW